MGALAANPAERIPEGDETARLALLDLDWDHVRAVDILAVLRSFLAKAGPSHHSRGPAGFLHWCPGAAPAVQALHMRPVGAAVRRARPSPSLM